MNLVLTRTEKTHDGIFGTLTDEHGQQIAVTLEHAFDAGHGNGSFAPKLPLGTYQCFRGAHKLHSQLMPFITFEVTGVPGHSGILFHVGNYNEDSDGCILLGKRRALTALPSGKMITNSKDTIKLFMDLQSSAEQFQLIVKDI